MAQLHGVGFGISSENRPGPIPVDGSRLPQATLQQQGMHQGLMRVPSTSPIAAPEFGNFVKPKPLSRYVKCMVYVLLTMAIFVQEIILHYPFMFFLNSCDIEQQIYFFCCHPNVVKGQWAYCRVLVTQVDCFQCFLPYPSQVDDRLKKHDRSLISKVKIHVRL